MKASRLRGNLLYVFCLASGFILYGGPRGPDSPQTWWQVAGAFLVLAGFAFSAYAAGWLAARKIFRTAPLFVLEFPLGLGLLAIWAQVTGLAGGLGYFPDPWLSPVLLLPPLASLDERWPRLGRRAGWDLPALLAGITFFLLFLVACLPDPMPDPLWYNLTSARWWMDAGRIFFPRENVSLFSAGSWDALYLWLMHFLGGPAGGGLIASQIAAQWLHLLAGGAGSFWALRVFFGRVFPGLRADACGLVALVACLSASQQTSVFLAKNDWGATLWVLSSLLALPESALLAGIFWGLALSAKLTVLFAGAPLLAWMVGRKWRSWGAIATGALLGAAPCLLRNFLYTGNPFFPVFSRWLHRPELADAWRRTSGYDGGPWLSFAHREALAKLVLADSPFFYLTVIAACLFCFGVRRRRSQLCAVVAVAALFFFLKIGAQAEYRLFGLGCLLMAGSGLAFFLEWGTERFPGWAQRREARLAGIILLFAAAAVGTSYPWRAPLDLARAPSPPEVIRQHFGGTAQAWVRLNLPPGTGVAGANEVRLYYLAEYRAYRIWDNVDLDRELRHSHSLAEAVAKMEAAGIQYLLFTRLDWDRYFRKDILDALENAWARHREVIAFGTGNSKVIDLRRMAGALRENPVPLANRDW